LSQTWDEAAASFDEEPDHGLHPAPVLAAWTQLLERWLPSEPVNILDIGCGTGSLSVVMAGMSHRVTAVDFSPAMIKQAQQKAGANHFSIPFLVMNAAKLGFRTKAFDVLVCRHVLWALPEPEKVLRQWAELVRENGRLILIEGFWHTGSGLHAPDIIAALPPTAHLLAHENLSQTAEYWGKEVTDERFAVILQIT
jgi:2-polyprenyl-3-methyl-5-hydroxy-6-metoxy-1,4-benzoquinol methylase